MFSEFAEIAQVTKRQGQFMQILRTQVILILKFTRKHAIACLWHRGQHFLKIVDGINLMQAYVQSEA